jgi:hypothetical protein
MMERYLRLVLLASLAALVGCEPPPASRASASAPPPPPSAAVPGAAGVEFAEVPASDPPIAKNSALPAASTAEYPVAAPGAVAAQTPNAAPNQPAEPAATSPAQSLPTRETPPVHLSAGVALPQLLPEGTQIGVSVDYRVRGNLNASRHVLVIESAVETIAVPVELSSQGGTLQGFCPLSVRPEHKPFRARIEELSASSRSRQPVSNTVDLATSY